MHPHFHLYVACAHVPTHAEPSPNVGSWTANTDCGPYICLSFFVLCKLKLLLERQTQTATHLTRKDASLLISRSHSFCAVLCVWTGIFSLGVIIVLMRKKRKKEKKKKNRIKEDFLAEQDWMCTACSVSGNQELYPLMVAYGGHEPSLLLKYLLGWPSNVYTKLFILFPAAVLNTKMTDNQYISQELIN